MNILIVTNVTCPIALVSNNDVPHFPMDCVYGHINFDEVFPTNTQGVTQLLDTYFAQDSLRKNLQKKYTLKHIFEKLGSAAYAWGRANYGINESDDTALLEFCYDEGLDSEMSIYLEHLVLAEEILRVTSGIQFITLESILKKLLKGLYTHGQRRRLEV